MEDFDYLGTGGFLMKCRHGETLGVTKEQADHLCQICPFFDACLNRDMVESTSKIINKPDWSLAIARHMIQLLVAFQTTLPSVKLYLEFMVQTDALLVEARLCNFVNYMATMNAKDPKFIEIADNACFRFSLIGKVKSEQWSRLIERDVLLNPEQDIGYFVRTQIPIGETKGVHIDSTQQKLESCGSYRVHSKFTIHALVAIQQVLA